MFRWTNPRPHGPKPNRVIRKFPADPDVANRLLKKSAVCENRPPKTLGFLHVFQVENDFFNRLLMAGVGPRLPVTAVPGSRAWRLKVLELREAEHTKAPRDCSCHLGARYKPQYPKTGLYARHNHDNEPKAQLVTSSLQPDGEPKPQAR